MDSSVYPDKDVIKASKGAVLIYANKDKDHGSGEVQQGKEKVTTCLSHFGIQCDEHISVYQATTSQFFSGTILMPTHILCNPDGTEITRKVGAMNSKEFVTFIEEGIKKLGPGLSKDDYAFARGKLGDAEAALEKDDLKAAVKACDEFKKNKALKNQAAWTKKVEDVLAKVDEAGQARVAKAVESAAAGNVEEAKKLLRSVIGECGALACAKSAKDELAKLPK